LRDSSYQRRQRLIGIALMCGAVALFACLDTIAKYLNTQMDTLENAWGRYTSAFALTLLVSNPLTHSGLLRTRSPKLQITRSILLVASTVLNFLALRWLQLDEALSIIFTFPLIVAILAGPMLGEWIGWRRWPAIGAGFAGELLITRPGLGGMHPAAVFSLAATVCYGLYAVITRIVRASTQPDVAVLFQRHYAGDAAGHSSCGKRRANIALMWMMTGVLGSAGHYCPIAKTSCARRCCRPSSIRNCSGW
jgi:drug/metabolite transporter (DMT)-like permease